MFMYGDEFFAYTDGDELAAWFGPNYPTLQGGVSEKIKDVAKTDPNCPKCERPPVANRWKAGEKNYVCGNGHNYTQTDNTKRDEAKAAECV